jgi:ABC-type glycerol-3-phosphate transport system substrate-binding protein
MQRKSSVGNPLFFPVAVALAGLAGCQRPATRDEPPPQFTGLTLTVACPGDPAAAVVRTFSKAWQGRTGARVAVSNYDLAKGPGDVEADVWVVPPAELPRWADAGALTPLPGFFKDRDNAYGWTGLLPLYRDRLLPWGRTADGTPAPWGVPLLGESPVLCYRTDLLPDGPPETWEQLARIVEARKEDPALPSLSDDASLEREFYTIAAGYLRRSLAETDVKRLDHRDQVFSFAFDVETGEPRIDASGFVHALTLMQRLQACRAPKGDGQPERAFLEGRALFCLTDASWVARFQGEGSKVRGRFSVCPMPGADRVFHAKGAVERVRVNRIPYLGSSGWLAVVPKRSARADAAFDLLAELSGPRLSAQVVQDPRWGGVVRADQLGDAMRWDSFGLDRPRTVALKHALQQTLLHPGVKNPVVCLRTPDQRDYSPPLAAELRRALEEKGDAAEALQLVAARWRQLIKARGGEKHRRDYRVSLGLLPGAD